MTGKMNENFVKLFEMLIKLLTLTIEENFDRNKNLQKLLKLVKFAKFFCYPFSLN